MIFKYRCAQFPNAVIEGVKFDGGYAEVDSSVYVERMNALNKCPFVEVLTTERPNFLTAEGEVSQQTLENRLMRKTKVELIKIAEEQYGYTFEDPTKITLKDMAKKIAEIHFINK